MAVSGGVQFDQTQGNADADLSDKTYRFVKATATAGGGIALCGAGEVAIGVLQNKPKLGEGCAVRFPGHTTKLVVDAGTDIAKGDKLKSDTNGKGVKTTADGDEVCAIALEAATEDNYIIEALIVQRQG